MAIPSPKDLGACPRCARNITKGQSIEKIGNNGPSPIMAHVGCKPATAGQRAVLAPSSTADELRKLQSQVLTPEVVNTDDSDDGDYEDESAETPVTSGSALSLSQLEAIVARSGEIAGRIAADSIAAKAADLVGAAVKMVMPRFEERVGTQVAKNLEAVSRKIESDAAAKIAEAGAQIDSKVAEKIEEAGRVVTDTITAATVQARAELDKVLESLRKNQEVVHKIIRPDGSEHRFGEGEVFHEAFAEVLELATLGMNVFLVGPTGCGKTHLAQQIAQALGLRFGIISGTAGTTEAEFTGTSYPNISTGESVFITTDFVECFENGGVFLLDEADALDPNCFLKINAALANGVLPLPKRHSKPVARKHDSFVCIVAANTFGHGATREYCGRNKLDDATVDRFRAGTVEMGYDAGVETRYACPDHDVYTKFKSWRDNIESNKFRRVLSTRVMRDFYKLHRAGWDMERIADKLVAGWSDKEAIAVIGRKRGERP